MFKLKTHTCFFVTSFVIVLGGVFLSFTPDNNTVIDIHDTYYVISNWDITSILFLIYLLIGIVYCITYKPQFKTKLVFSSIHTSVTCGSVYIYWILYPFLNYLDNSIFSPGYLNILTVVLFLLTILVQPLFIINIIIRLTRRK